MKRFFFAALACAFAGSVLFSCSGNGEGTNDSAKVDTTLPKPLRDLNAKLRSDPNNLDLYHERAKYFIEKKQFKEAEADIRRIFSVDSSKSPHLMTAADLYFFMNRSGRAKQLLERVMALDPKNTEARQRLAQLYIYTDQFQPALNQLDTLLMQNENNAQAYFMKGMVFKLTKDTAKAISSMQTAVEQDPEYYNAYIQLGLLHAAKHSRLAVEYYMNALRIQPQSTEAMYSLGKFYQDEGEYNLALETYTALLKADPNHYDTHFNLGAIHAKLKKYDQAITYFSQAIQIDDRQPRGYYGRGYSYEMSGDIARATEDYRFALGIDPNYEDARISLNRVLGGGKK